MAKGKTRKGAVMICMIFVVLRNCYVSVGTQSGMPLQHHVILTGGIDFFSIFCNLVYVHLIKSKHIVQRGTYS